MRHLFKYTFLTALLCSTVWSCKKGEQSSVEIQPEPIALEAADSCVIGGPINNIWEIKISGDKAVTYNYADSGFVAVYDYPSFNYHYSYGLKGGGEDEWIAPMYGTSDTPDEILLYDMAKQKLYAITIGDSTAMRNLIADLPVDGEGLALPFGNISKISQRPYLAKINDMKKGCLEARNMDGSEPASTYPTELTVVGTQLTGYPWDDFKYAANSDYVVVAYCEKDYMAVLRYDDESLAPLFNIGEASTIDGAPGATHESHALQVVEHGGLFYILRPSDNGSTGHEIDVIDPAARRMYTLMLDRDVRHIALDDQDNLIGIYETENDNAVVRYPLSR